MLKTDPSTNDSNALASPGVHSDTSVKQGVPEINLELINTMFSQHNNPAVTRRVRNIIKLIILVNNNNEVPYTEQVREFFGTYPTHRTITDYAETINALVNHEVVQYGATKSEKKNVKQDRVWYREEKHKHVLIKLALALKTKLKTMRAGLSHDEKHRFILLDTGTNYNLQGSNYRNNSKFYSSTKLSMSVVYRIMKKYSLNNGTTIQREMARYY